jgi:heat shock protein HtpX
MRRIALRLLMAAVGLAVLAAYVGGALLVAASVRSLWVEGGSLPTLVALFVALSMVAGYLGYRFGTGRLLAGLDAFELERGRAPGLYRRVDDLAARMDVDSPTILVARLRAPNAFAIGGGDGVVVVDRTLFRLLAPAELEAIVAHELAHLASRDGLVQTLAHSALRAVAGPVLLVSFPFLLALTGVARGAAWIAGRPSAWRETLPGRLRLWVAQGLSALLLVGTLLVLARSRRREFAADDRAAAATGDPLALARGLRRIERASTPPRGLFAPLGAPEEEHPLGRLLATHPATDERVERLLERAERDRREGVRRIEIR